MILCDAGPLIALLDKSQPGEVRAKCRAVLPQLAPPLVTTWPSFNEALYLTQKIGGRSLQQLLRRFEKEGILEIYPLTRPDITRIEALREEYKNLSIDTADASLIVAAEVLGLTRIFTFNENFRFYKINGTQPFEIIP
ncbi:MAG: PIN domain-containing protein [Chloroflexi bacterium]|nr:PIN domain-containing protein [Chloroflexota bacterium]OJV95222.1 MAG: hypothetical protein BGO39_24760 [Chloroflexi bacterium 54-19]